MGLRFAFAGGREGWVRALLTAVGVGLGVALLLLTTAIPNALAARERPGGRPAATCSIGDDAHQCPRPTDTPARRATPTPTFRDRRSGDVAASPKGRGARCRPASEEFPAPGEMVVSPALDELLESDAGKLLRERLPHAVVGTIGESGLIGSAELAFYRGADELADAAQRQRGGSRSTGSGRKQAASRRGRTPSCCCSSSWSSWCC